MTDPRNPDRDRDREIHEMLRAPVERLAPPEGSWDHVFRRARRRKWAKAGLAAAAVVVIAAGAIPAVIGVRDHSSDQRIEVASTPTTSPRIHAHSPAASPSTSPSPKVTASVSTTPASSASMAPVRTTPLASYGGSLTGFRPMSLSFVSETVGYAWGTVGSSKLGVVAETLNAGGTWFRLDAAPAVDATLAGAGTGDDQIRFVSGTTGYIYGSSLYVTTDDGESWTALDSHGYVDDLEAVGHQAWALTRAGGVDSTSVQLFHASAEAPELVAVSDVPPTTAPAGADSIAVNSTATAHHGQRLSVDVVLGSTSFWQSANGTTWRQYASPCPVSDNGGQVQGALLTASAPTPASVVAACGYNIGGGSEDKEVWATTNAGKSWHQTPQPPAASGYLQTFSAGTHNDLVIGESRADAQVTLNGGKTWKPLSYGGFSFSFVGFIAPTTIVALASPGDSSVGAFASSSDVGTTWPTFTQFGK